MDYSDIQSISLLIACQCNLNCEYCQIAKSINENTVKRNLQSKTIQALKDGTYLNNVKQTLNKLNMGYNQITQMSIWGQEPTLILDYLTEHFENWLETFDKLLDFSFSTNGMENPQSIVNFIKKIDNNVDHPFTITVQFSYDGEQATANVRKADGDIIQKNLLYFLHELNKIQFNYVKVNVHVHNVVSLNVIRENNSTEKVIEFYKQIDEWMAIVNKANTNAKVNLAPTIFSAIEAPVEATVDDGLLFADFIRRGMMLDCGRNGYNPGWTLLHIYDNYFEHLDELKLHTAKEILELKYIDEEKYNEIFRRLSNTISCGQNYGELKIMYDGKISPCPNLIFSTNAEDIIDDGSISASIRKGITTRQYFNALTDSKEQVDKVVETFRILKEDSYLYIFHHVLTMMELLANVNQIDSSYKKDRNKMIEHAFFLAGAYGCSFNNQVMTASLYHKHSGLLKLFCNGAMDLIFGDKENFVTTKQRDGDEFRRGEKVSR